MSIFAAGFKRLINWLRTRGAIGSRRERLGEVIVAAAGSASPTYVGPTDAVLVRSGARDKWLRFGCPDGCGETIVLDLSPTRRPHWSVDLHSEGTISVYPSVVNRACSAHFLIRRNRIVWVPSRKGRLPFFRSR